MDLRERFDMALQRASVRSVAELARMVGVSAPSIFEVVCGQRPGNRLLPRIAQALGVDERWLRFGDVDVAPEWFKIQPGLLAELKGITEQVRSTKSKPRLSMRELLESMLTEQRAIRQALDRLAKQAADPVEVAPRRQAVIPRHAAESDLAPVPSTRSDAEL